MTSRTLWKTCWGPASSRRRAAAARAERCGPRPAEPPWLMCRRRPTYWLSCNWNGSPSRRRGATTSSSGNNTNGTQRGAAMALPIFPFLSAHCFVIMTNQSSFTSRWLRFVKKSLARSLRSKRRLLIRNRGRRGIANSLTSFLEQFEGGAGMARLGSRRRSGWCRSLVGVDQWSRSRFRQRTHAADGGAQELELAQHDPQVSVCCDTRPRAQRLITTF